jgi:hypothetical protein
MLDRIIPLLGRNERRAIADPAALSAASPLAGRQHECLIYSFRGKNDTVYRGIIIAGQIIYVGVIYVISSII